MRLLKKFIGFKFFDSLLSYFTFMTLVFTSVSFLLMTGPAHMWWLVTMQVAYFFVIVSFTILFGLREYKKIRKMQICYLMLLAAITFCGCILNRKYHLIATAIILIATFIFSKLKQCQNFKHNSEEHKFLTWLSRVFRSRIFYGISQSILVFGPFVLLGFFWLQISTINIFIRVVLFSLYLFVIPMMSIMEDLGQTEEQYRRAYVEDLKKRGKEPPIDL